jgi:Uma2 family endonuclease
MGMPAIRRHWTTDEVRPLLENSDRWPRFELIDGELIVTPSPGFAHQIAQFDLASALRNYLKEEKLGFALLPPADIQLKPETITQPDVFVLPRNQSPAKDDRPLPVWKDIKRLLLVVEIISPSSIRIDRITKREFYLNRGVPEYWVVDLDAMMVERWTLQSDRPEVLRDSLDWKPAGAKSSFHVDLPEFFAQVREEHRQLRID